MVRRRAGQSHKGLAQSHAIAREEGVTRWPTRTGPRIDDQIAKLRMVELHRHAMAEVGLLARRAAEMVHRAHFLEIADALGPASRKLDADIGLLDAGSLARPP